MFSRVRRYADLPLGIAVVTLLILLVAALLGRRFDEIWRTPPPRVILPAVSEPAPPPVAAPTPPAPAPAASAEPSPAPVPRYALEAGPFLAAEAADRMEELLNGLGYATVRFRAQDLTRRYRVILEGFESLEAAKRAVAELGRGTLTETPTGQIRVEVTKSVSLKDAVATGRALRARGYEARIDSTESPTFIYHLRYGQFLSESEARARARELELLGIESRVVRSK